MEIPHHFVQEGFSHTVLKISFFLNVAEFHSAFTFIVVSLKWHGSIIAAVELFTDDSGAEGIAVQTDHEIQHGGSVGGVDHSRVIELGQDFLSKVGRGVRTLVKGQARIIFQLIKGDEGI